MKRILLFTLFLTFFSLLHAQSPLKFRYQAVARDASGAVITGIADVRITFLANGPDGNAVYTETHHVTSNAQGIFDLEIGNGAVVSGDLKTLDWSANAFWLKIDLKTSGQADFVEMGKSQLLSVPYALHAASGGTEYNAGEGIAMINHNIINTGDLSETNELQTLSLNGNQLNLSQGGGTITLPTGGSDSWTTNGNTISNIPNNYRVAIGATQATDAKFFVTTGGADYAGRFESTGSGSALVGTNSATGHGVYGGSTNGIGGTFVSVNGTGGFFSSGSGNALVTDMGNVGIGTTNPARKLQVNGNTLLYNPNGIALETAGKVGIGVTNPTNKLEVNGTSFLEASSGNALIVGNGNIGFGVNNPSRKLEVHGGPDGAFFATSSTGIGIWGQSLGNLPAGYFYSSDGIAGDFNGVNNFALYATQGAFGYAAGKQGMAMNCNGSTWKLFIDSSHDYNFGYNNNLKAYIDDVDGSYHVYSDRALKKNIKAKTGVLPGLLQLGIYTYNMKSADDLSNVTLGFMADEVAAQFPELVIEKEGYKSLCYDNFAVLAVQGIKEQQSEIDALKQEVAELKALIRDLKSSIANTSGH